MKEEAGFNYVDDNYVYEPGVGFLTIDWNESTEPGRNHGEVRGKV